MYRVDIERTCRLATSVSYCTGRLGISTGRLGIMYQMLDGEEPAYRPSDGDGWDEE